MIGFFQLFLVAYAVATVAYFLVTIYSRSIRREKLEDEWAEEGEPGDRSDYVKDGLKSYDHSLRRKAIYLIFVLPVIMIAILIYVQNF